jgi:DNA invertase Pin-like site-specific DNA recombinase
VVSSSPQELSLDAQEQWAQETATAHGWTITRSFRGVSSGREGARQLLETLLDELRDTAKADRPKYVLMVRLDRLGRGTGIEGIAALAEIRRLGTSIWTREDGLVRLERASDAILPTIRSIVAALENETRSDRVRAGKARRRAAGLHNGNPPYGCTLLDGRAVAYEPEAMLACQIFERRAAGWGYDRLARFAAERAIPKLLHNGKARRLRWGRSTIQRLLWCRTLRGTAIPEELWDDANAIANPDFKTRKQRSWPYPLAGALRCTCGTMLSGQASGRHGSRERYYVCRSVAEHGYYPHWRAQLVEAGFEGVLRRLKAAPALLCPETPAPNLQILEAKERAVATELDAIDARRQQLWEKAPALTGPQIRERLDEIEAARKNAARARDLAREELEAARNRSESAAALSDVIGRLATEWSNAPLDLKQAAARAVSAVVFGLFLEPARKLEARERRRGQQQPIIYVGFEEATKYAASVHMSENMREVDTLRNVDMAQRKMDAFRTIATRQTLIAAVRRASRTMTTLGQQW